MYTDFLPKTRDCCLTGERMKIMKNMTYWIKRLFWCLIFQAPRKMVVKNYFINRVTNKWTHIYKDTKGQYWLATSLFDRYRESIADGASTVMNLKLVADMSKAINKTIIENVNEEMNNHDFTGELSESWFKYKIIEE